MLLAHRDVIGMGDVLPPLAEQLRMLVADDVAERPVQQEEAAIEVLVDDADGGVLERAAEPRLALAQGRFGLPEFLQQGEGGRRIADDEAPLPGLVRCLLRAHGATPCCGGPPHFPCRAPRATLESEASRLATVALVRLRERRGFGDFRIDSARPAAPR